MAVTDTCEVIVAVLHPHLVPAATGIRPPATALTPADFDDAAASSADSADDDLPDAYTTIHAAQRAEWTRFVGELNSVREWGEDPLLSALDAARRRRDQIDEDIRLLITLGREYIGPRPYDYATLARAAGLTQYLVRKAYTADDIACIRQITGLGPLTPSDLQTPVAS
ncbi:hypothetical protein [Streptomyces chartreusis]|uniref:hypothetical protein n=1 Tax=Streptomyces chartreusis TaxID=1969 RepID=UPI00367C6024